MPTNGAQFHADFGPNHGALWGQIFPHFVCYNKPIGGGNREEDYFVYIVELPGLTITFPLSPIPIICFG
jgi:hypothetical protein